MSDPKFPNGALPTELKEEYLNQIAAWLLEEWRATEDDLTRETDTPYTRGTTRFGRQKERITQGICVRAPLVAEGRKQRSGHRFLH